MNNLIIILALLLLSGCADLKQDSDRAEIALCLMLVQTHTRASSDFPDLDFPDLDFPDLDFPDLDFPDLDFPDQT